MDQHSKLPNMEGTRLPTEVVNPAAGERLESEDALEVHELVHRVYLAEDSRDYDALRVIFTEDAVHDHSIYGRVKGAEAIVEFVRANLAQGFDGIRHHALNVTTRRAGENQAEAVSYVVPLKLFPGPGEGRWRLAPHPGPRALCGTGWSSTTGDGALPTASTTSSRSGR